MRLRKLALAMGLVGVFNAEFASSLGLGDIKLNSHLNQPLQAEIKLLQTKDLSAEEVMVQLASREDFSRAGVDRLFFLTGLKFAVDMEAPGGPAVRISTERPVREPYLNFLLEGRWPSGRILREYTLLLDPPREMTESVAPAASTQSRPTAGSTSGSSSASTPSSSMSTPAGTYGPVKASDTLWEIALEVRPSSEVSARKTMLALQRKNPEAFINNNINLLRRGQILQVPALDEIDALTEQQALAEVAQQNTDWNSNVDAEAPVQAADRLQDTAESTGPVEGRLTLGAQQGSGVATTEVADPDAASSTATETAAAIADLEEELTSSQEVVAATERENTELRDKVTELEAQLETMERLVEVSNAELEAVQNAAASAQQSQAPETPAASTGGWLDILKDNILYAGAGVVALLAAVFFLLSRRQEEDSSEAFSAEQAPPVTAGSFASAEAAEMDAETPVVPEPAPVVEAPVTPTVKAQTADAVAEADIYLGLGKTAQAEELLRQTLEADPDHSGARLKLMEICADRGDAHGFEQNFAALTSVATAAEITRAETLQARLREQTALDEPAAETATELDYDALSDADESDIPELTLDSPLAEKDVESEDVQSEVALNPLIDSEADDDSAASAEPLEFVLDLDDEPSTTEAVAEVLDGDPDTRPAEEVLESELDLTVETGVDMGLESPVDGSETMEFDPASFGGGEDADEFSLDSLTAEAATAEPFPTLDLDGADTSDVDALEDLTGEATEFSPNLAEELGASDSSDDAPGNDDDLFSAALGDLPSPEDVFADDELSDEDLDGEFDFLADTDETATKLDLARAYIDMGDHAGARDILDEVVQEGDDGQRSDAEELLARLG